MRHLFDSPLGVDAPLGVPKNVLSAAGAAILAAGISATASTAGTVYNNYQANLANEEAYERTKELQKLQFEHQKELYEHQFKKESEYNSPVHLRQLYEQAGYNPALLAHNGDIGKAATSPAMPSVPSATPFGPRQVFPLDLGGNVGGISSALAVGSEVKKNNAEAFQKIVSSLPELGKSLGWENARQYAKDMLGILGVADSQYERQIEAYIKSLEYQNESVSLQNEITRLYGKETASNALAIQEQTFNKMAAEIGLMHTQGEVNYAQVNKLASDYLRNLAEAFKLKKEGEYFVASADQARAMKSLISLQGDRLSFENKKVGVGSDVEDFYDSKYYKKHLKRGKEIDVNQYSSLWIRTLDKLFIDYIKVSGGAVGSYNEFNGSTTHN